MQKRYSAIIESLKNYLTHDLLGPVMFVSCALHYARKKSMPGHRLKTSDRRVENRVEQLVVFDTSEIDTKNVWYRIRHQIFLVSNSKPELK